MNCGNIVLASASPRRKELLKKIVPEFEIDAAKGEEKAKKFCPKKRRNVLRGIKRKRSRRKRSTREKR